MSRIDARDSLAAADAARQLAPAEAAARQRPPAAVGPVRRNVETDIRPKPRDAARLEAMPRIGATLVDDLRPFSGMSRDRLISGLSRLEIAVEDELDGETDPDRIAELELGRQILGEQIRRLRLVQTAADALVAK
ncbi:MAG: hypothetical protein R3D02_08985 [Hyphomicrobiales bacterium]